MTESNGVPDLPVPERFSIPAAAAQDLEQVCRALEALSDGAAANLGPASAALARVAAWARSRTPASPGDASSWKAGYAGQADVGGTLTCTGNEYEFVLSFDAQGVPYAGMWLRAGGGKGGAIKIDDGQLVYEKGGKLDRCDVPAEAGLVWGSVTSVLRALATKPSSKPPAAAVCAVCRRPLAAGVKFCVDCGAPVGAPPQPAAAPVCPACGNPAPPGNNF